MITRLDQHILLRIFSSLKQHVADLLRTRRVRSALDHHERHGRDLREHILTAKSVKRIRFVVQVRVIRAEAADELILLRQAN